MITPEKIEAWIAEAVARPDSAAQIIRQIAARLEELSQQNESLRAENIALRSGARVEEYERRIAHLEYQLALIRRRIGADATASDESEISVPLRIATKAVNLLLYDSFGRILRWELAAEELTDRNDLGLVVGDLTPNGETLRILVVPRDEELLFLFSSGRITTMAVSQIPLTLPTPPPSLSPASQMNYFQMQWEQSPIPVTPNAGEELACLAPLSHLALANYLIQVSRKGCVKKIRAAMGQSILANRYIGPGIRQSPDQPFDLILGGDGDQLVLVTCEGFLQCLAVDHLSPSIEEGLRLESGDYLVGAFIMPPGRDLIAMTQVGKAIHWTADRLETGRSFRSRGQALFSAARREQGVRVVGAGAVSEADWAVALHRNGRVSLHAARDILNAGAIAVEEELLAFVFFSTAAI